MESVNEKRDIDASFAGDIINGHALGKNLRSFYFQFSFRLMYPTQYTCNNLLFQHISFKIYLKLIKTMAKILLTNNKSFSHSFN
jgi:hypothetical protein